MKLKYLYELKNKKNLLAFSAGVDSSALFFLLMENDIDFDIALVNYQTREQSDVEMEYAKALAKQYGKKIYTLVCKLDVSNFEKKARDTRYGFFGNIIAKHGYGNLLLAHQLDDRFEWLMMQVCKGAGVCELVGFKGREQRDGYVLLRPLIDVTRQEILMYLKSNDLPYFVDKSNEDVKYKRNEFRKLCKPLVSKYSSGIRKSLNYLRVDGDFLDGKFYKIIDELFIYELKDDLINMRLIDKASKQLGFVMSRHSREHSLSKNAVINRAVAVGKNERFGFISPYCKVVMDKKFKEKCRILKIPTHIRGYLYKKDIDPQSLGL